MNLWHYLYLPAAEARHIGFTHHGTLFGLPAWVHAANEDELMACPKVPILGLYTRLMDWIFSGLMFFVPEDFEIALPHSVGKEIGDVA